MRIQATGLLIAAALSYVTAGPPAPWQDPPGGRRPGPPDRGEQDPGRPPRPEDDEDGPPPPPFGPPPNPLFLAIDTDDDGELSPKEIANASKSIAKLDRNKDGIITEEEVRPPRPGGRRGPGGPGGGPPGGGPPGGGPPGGGQAGPGRGGPDGPLDRGGAGGRAGQPPARRPGPPADDEDHGRPVEAVAKELGVTPEKFREVFKKVRPARPGQQPTEAQRQENRKVLSEGLGVSPERLDEVMDKYRPGGKVQDGSPR